MSSLSGVVSKIMQEQSVLEVPANPANGTSDLLSRLYREIGISAVAAALEVNHINGQRPAAETIMVPAVQAAAR
jgi:hypothetical protein